MSKKFDMSNDLKVLLVGPSVSGGGAEGRFRNLAINLFDGKCDIVVQVSNEDTNKYLQGKNYISLDWKTKLSYVSCIRKTINILNTNHYDVIFSFGLFPNIICIISHIISKNDGILIIHEITRPLLESRFLGYLRGGGYKFLRKILYPFADIITSNSIDGLRETFDLVGKKNSTKGKRLPNIIDVGDIENIIKNDNREIACIPNKYFVVVSRLVKMKMIDDVLLAFKLLENYQLYSLIIVGDGPDRERLEKIKYDFKIGNCNFLGFIKNPYKLVKNSIALISASKYEGFSNSILEAMVQGVPVITSLCSSDSIDMCKSGAAMGFKVGDISGLSAKMEIAYKNNSFRSEIVNRAYQYSFEHIKANSINIYERSIIQFLEAKT